MRSVKIEYKKIVKHKTKLIFLCQIKIKFYVFWNVIVFLFLRDNKQSPWINILGNMENKNLVLHEKQFCVERKV